MTSFLECRITIAGQSERVEKLLENVSSENQPLDFDRIVPYPEKYKIMDKAFEEWSVKYADLPSDKCPSPAPQSGFANGGYDWCRINWGTKWNAQGEFEVVKSSNKRKHTTIAKIYFCTAWCPPFPIMTALSKKDPYLTFTLSCREWSEDKWESMTFRNGKSDQPEIVELFAQVIQYYLRDEAA